MIKKVQVLNSEGNYLTYDCDEYEYDLSHIKLRKDGNLVAVFNNYKHFYIIRGKDE